MLRVTVEPAKDSVGPGEDLEVVITATDQLGRPAKAEVSLALVDRALLRLYGDTLPPIGPFFYDQARTGAFATEVLAQAGVALPSDRSGRSSDAG